MKNLFLTLTICFGVVSKAMGAAVGVVDADEKRGDIDNLLETLRVLGHTATRLPPETALDTESLSHYDCVILDSAGGPLPETGYRALGDYLRDGGSLLITGLGAYWMKTPTAPYRTQIRGEGPLREIAGVKIADHRPVGVKKFVALDKNAAIAKGLPESFAVRTVPPYDNANPAHWRDIGVYPLRATSAETLIKVETVDRDGRDAESPFLTVKQWGRGKCYRLAITNLSAAIYKKREISIARILNNLLREARDRKRNNE